MEYSSDKQTSRRKFFLAIAVNKSKFDYFTYECGIMVI